VDNCRYPTEDDKKLFMDAFNLTLMQVNNWFINARYDSLMENHKEGIYHLSSDVGCMLGVQS
jgi:hypothetical protein